VLVGTAAAHYPALAALVGLDAGEVAARIEGAGIPAAFDTGGLGADDFVAAVRRALEAPALRHEDVERAWDEVIREVDPVVAGLAATFASAGRLVLASNTDPFHWRAIRPRLAEVGVDCPAYLSFEIGAKKPAAAFFAAVAADVPAGSWFVDDSADNVAAAVEHGLSGWVHRDPTETAARLASLLR
jgi:FMN phosphatase YigB (HAD superfamily)